MFLEGRRRFSYPVGRLETLAASAENIVTAVQPLLVITAPAAYPLAVVSGSSAYHLAVVSFSGSGAPSCHTRSGLSACRRERFIRFVAAYPLAVISFASHR